MNGQTLFDQLSDPNHPIRQREWNTFLERRQFLYDDIVAKLGLGAASIGAGFEQDPLRTIDAMAILEGYERMKLVDELGAIKNPNMRQRDYQQLIGTAIIYGIENPESLPVGVLQQQIEEARVRRRSGERFDMVDELRAGAEVASDMIPTGGMFNDVSLTYKGPFYLGALDAMLRTAETIPFGIGDFVSKQESAQALNQWIGMTREAFMGDLDGRELLGAQLGEGAGNLVGYIAPGIASWKLAGWGMGAVGIGGVTRASQVIRGNEIIQTAAKTWGLAATNPILFHGIQTGLASALLEAGGDGPIQERATNVAFGTGLGVALAMGGPVAAGAAGALGGAIIGSAADEPLAGAATGLSIALAGHRAFKAFSRNSGLNNARQSTWFDVHLDPSSPLQIPRGNVSRAPRVVPDPPRGLPPGQLERSPTSPAFSIGAGESPAGLLPQTSGVSRQISDYTWRGTRSLFYYGKEAPEELVQRWGSTVARGFSRADEPFATNIFLDNTGKVQQGATHVHMVEASFDNLFVLTPESAPVFRNIVGPVGDFQGIENALKQQGFDGLAVQGIDEFISRDFGGRNGIDVAFEDLGIPSPLLSDQVIAFGAPQQVKFSKTIVNGDITSEVLDSFGMDAVQKVAGVQSVTFGREAAKNLRPFEVGELAARLGDPPERLSDMRGLMFERAGELADNPLVPAGITRAVVQNHELTGPRVVLLDESRTAQATIPVGSFDEGLAAVRRLGFVEMPGNSREEAVRLAHAMTNADLFTNNSMTHILGQVDSPLTSDLVAISYAENPGRVSVVQSIGSPWDLRRQIATVNDRYGTDLDFDKNIRVVERPANTFHALIGPEGSITDKMVNQFKEFGVFSGMEAGTTSGVNVRVNSVWREAKTGRARASISPIYSNIKATVPLEAVMPGRTSVQQPLTGDVYKKFKEFAIGKFNADAERAGLPLVSEIADPSVLSLIDSYIDDYAKGSGLSLFDTGRFADALEWNIAQDMRRLAGDEGKIFDEMLRVSADEITKATENGTYLIPDVEELAVMKGFIWEPAWGGRQAQLVDQLSNTIIPFQTRESAEAFLRGFNRSLPDINTKGMSPMAAFSSFDSHAIKSRTRGIEFPDENVEIQATAKAIHYAAQEADQGIRNAKAFAAADDFIRASEAPPTQPPTTFAEPPDNETLGALIHRMNMEVASPLPELVVDNVEGLITQLKGLSKHQVDALRKLMHQPHIWLTAPTRTATAIFDDKLRSFGIPRPTMWRDASAMLDGKTKATNEAAPWIDEVWGYLNVFNRGDRRLGPLYEVMTANSTVNTTPNGDPILLPSGHSNERELLMDFYKFTPTMKLAVTELRGVLDRLHGAAAAFTDIGYIMDYLPKLRYFLDLHGEKGWKAWEKSLPKNLQWFALYARDGNLQAYQKDVGRVLETYIRGLFFEKHVRVPFEHMKAQWARPDLPDPIKEYTEKLLFTLRHGHPPNHDPVIRGLTALQNQLADVSHKVLGTPRLHLTEGEILNGIGQGMTWQYRNALGNRIHTNLRELYQPLKNAAHIGLGDSLGAYSAFLKSPDVRREFIDRAVKYGWAEPERAGVVNAEFATGEMKDIKGNQILDPEVLAAREAWAAKWDKIHDRLPNKLKNGIEGIPIVDPNWFYRNYATNPSRIVAANAAYLHAQKAIVRYVEGKTNFSQLLDESTAGNRRWSIQQEFIDKMNAGDLEGAAVVIGGQGAASMYHFGIAEQAEGIRQSGIFGRGIFQFTNFSNQFAWETAVDLKYVKWGSMLKYVATLGTLAFLPGIIGRKVGWPEMDNFNWFLSLGAGGGIIVDPAVNMIHAQTAYRKMALGQDLSPEERFAIQRSPDLMMDLVQTLNPTGHQGTIRTIQGFAQAASQPTDEDIAEATFRMILGGRGISASGERGVESYIDSLIEGQSVRPEPRWDTTINEGGQNLQTTQAEWERFNQMLDSIVSSPGGAMN